MKTFSFLFRIRSELWCELPARIAFEHLSLFGIWKRENGKIYSQRETSRCVLSLAVETIYCSQETDTSTHRWRHRYHCWQALVLNKKSHFLFGRGLGKTVELIWHWSECLYESLSSKGGDFIDLSKSFSIIASVKCRSSSFRWIDIKRESTAWTIYRYSTSKKETLKKTELFQPLLKNNVMK